MVHVNFDCIFCCSELIKNKTLQFLARSLPFLKQDISNIPKVAKLPTESNLDADSLTQSFTTKNNKHDAFHSNPASLQAVASHLHHHHFLHKRSLQNLTKFRNHFYRRDAGFPFGMNLTEARQKVCEQNDGM